MSMAMLQPNDVIPLGCAPGRISVLANHNGLRFLPPNRAIEGQGNMGYWSVDLPVHCLADAIALRLLGIGAADIAVALGSRTASRG